MPTVEEQTDPFAASFTPPPTAGEGVCAICHSWTGTTRDGGRYRRCSSCDRTVGRVEHPVKLVVPISLVTVGSQFYSVLDGYKNSRNERARDLYGLRAGALLARFLRDHGECVAAAAGGEWDCMTIVPSSQARVGIHPLETVVKMARAHHVKYGPLLEATGRELDHREADEHGYRVTSDVDGKKVLVLDDTFTSGARVQSAASALGTAGADVMAVVALGRVIHPSFSDEAKELWDQQSSIDFDFNACCIEP